MRLSLKSSKGFTLVELMLVVAVVGVLSAVSVSQYQHFVAKARQSEAKIALASIYAAETAFFAEKSSYTACLRQIGYVPDGTVRYYGVGFGFDAANDPSKPCGPNGDQLCTKYEFSSPSPFASACSGAALSFAQPLTFSDVNYTASAFYDNGSFYKYPLDWHLAGSANGIPTVVTSTSFVAGAVGAIVYKPEKTALHGEPNNINTPYCCDGWQIDQNKVLINSFPGI